MNKLNFSIEGNKVVVRRERRVLTTEKAADPQAKYMIEVVSIVFSDDEPQIVVNRDLCGE